MPSVFSSPDVADELLEVVGPGFATDWTLARGTNLNKMEIEGKRNEKKFLTWILALQDPQMWCPTGQLYTGRSFLN